MSGQFTTPALAPLVTPRPPSDFGPVFWASFGDTDAAPDWLTTSGGNIATVRDRGGSNLTMTGTAAGYGTASAPPVNGRGKRRAYADMYPKGGTASEFAGTGLLGGTPSGPVPFTMLFSVCFTERPSAGSTEFDGLMMIGPTGVASSLILASSNQSGNGFIQPMSVTTSPADQTMLVAFGTEKLDDDTAGDVVPSYQVIIVRHYLSDADAKWYVDIYVDGVFAAKHQAGSSGGGITLASDDFKLGTWFGGCNGPRHRIFDAAWFPRALATDDVRSVSLWCLNEVAAQKTAAKCLGDGDSIMEGFSATGNNGYFAQLSATYEGAYSVPLLTYNGGTNGMNSMQAQSSLPANWAAIAERFSVRSRYCFALIALSVNDITAPITTDGLLTVKNLLALAKRYRDIGCLRVFVATTYQCNVAKVGGYNGVRNTVVTLLRATDWPNYVRLIDLEDTSDTRVNPCSGALAGTYGELVDLLGMQTLTITAAADNGGGKVRLTITETVPSDIDGHTVTIAGLSVCTEANGNRVATYVDAHTIDLAAVSITHTGADSGTVSYTVMFSTSDGIHPRDPGHAVYTQLFTMGIGAL